MSYRVLARKYRSRTLEEVVGQDPIVTTLRNAIAGGRVHHGYLFCGTRGVGKTSMARILAKCLNCLQAEDIAVTPCLECDSCLAIAEGDDIDVIEIDAASNTGVDNIRDLRSNAGYRPARSRYKVYIIDEVHMLSTGAFNALLKTLEEPPPHVKFILATTEQQKVPATIQSRVQRFEFHSISREQIAQRLCDILTQEGIEVSDAVVQRVARHANGSMRDALSLLDQLLSFADERLDERIVDEVLPVAHDERLSDLVACFAGSDASRALELTDAYLSTGQTLERFCDQLIAYLRNLMLLRVCGASSQLPDIPEHARQDAIQQSGFFPPATFVYLINILQELRRQLRSSSCGRALVDATMVRMSCIDQFTNVDELLDRLSDAPADASKKKRASRRVDSVGTGAGSSLPQAPKVGSAQPSPSGEKAEALRPDQVRVKRNVAHPEVIPRGVTNDDMLQVRKDPLVREALELYQGTLMNVQRIRSDVAVIEAEDGEEDTNQVDAGEGEH